MAVSACCAAAWYGASLRRPSRLRDSRRSALRPIRADPRGVRWFVRLAALARPLEPLARSLIPQHKLEEARHLIVEGAQPHGMTFERYLRYKALLPLLVAVFLYRLGVSPLPHALAVLATWFGIDRWLRSAANDRRAELDRELPDFLDVLAVAMQAGVPFVPALRTVCDGLRGPLGAEFLKALAQMELGLSRREALERIRHRSGSRSLGRFVAALLQADELGVPLADALTDLATEVRAAFYQSERRRAAREVPVINFLVTLFIVPAVVVVISMALLTGSGADLGRLLEP